MENFVKRMDRIRERSEDKTMNKWLDTQDVCQTLNICPRTVQTLRDNGTLAYTQISHKTYYKPEDVMAIVAVVEDRKKDMRFRKRTD
ncbi:helix-turn-helix domain-containing protein [Segatella copri]|uniref:helix-turn-helix domain-containing protein n=1 Tax=Segatella copri TaxID=165179 RepID=UPI0020CBBA6E|nr:helix-turn-helix domain-containing protein [Segatella copri]MCP9583014.1 helix-turn-helix domain-containing protein [Segatella copri]